MSENGEFSYTKPVELLKGKQLVKICAPMVRYSKLAFRTLVRKYGCDLAFTPMIVCDSFVSSQKARDSEFITNERDRPLVVQFAAANGKDLADAAEIVYLRSDGIDLNCGCPQRWAVVQGYGSSLMNKPEVVKDMIYQVRNRVPNEEFTISLKTRIHSDIRKTVEFCQNAEKAGVAWIAVHGRTETQRGEPINMDGIRIIKDSISIPVIGNGDVFSLADGEYLKEKTGVGGIMSARGLLQNPSLFIGSDHTPVQCVKDWIDLSLSLGVSFNIFHQHLVLMLEKLMSKTERKVFNSLCSTGAVLDYLQYFFDCEVLL